MFAAPNLYLTLPNWLTLVRQRAQGRASRVGGDRDYARSLSAHHAVTHRAIRLGTSSRTDRNSCGQKIGGRGCALSHCGELVTALTGASRSTVIGQVCVEQASRRNARNASCARGATRVTIAAG